MSKYRVTVADMQSAINELNSNNSEFRSRVNELSAKQQELAGQWQGDANTAFNNAFNSDKGQWDVFASLIDQYIETLHSIMQTYKTAEETNRSTAATRTYH